MKIMETFRCDRQSMTISRPGCARLYESTKVRRPAPWEARHKCLACPIGAANSGQRVSFEAAAADEWRLVCPRCLRSASRMIQGGLCISCYNRAREAWIGRNRKGTRPRLCGVLHTERLAVMNDGGVHHVERNHVVSAAEAMVTLARRAKAPLCFGWGRAHE